MLPADAAAEVRAAPPADVTVAQWLGAWPVWFPTTRRPETVAHDEYMLAPFVRQHGRRRLASIRRLEAQEWATANPTQLRYLRRAFEKARVVGLLEENVWDRVQLARGRRAPVLAPSPVQLDGILAGCRVQGGWWCEFADMVEVAAFTGARLGGLASLRVSAVDLGRRRLTLTEKGEKTRTVALTPRAWSALERALGRAARRVDPDPLVFLSPQRRPLNRNSVGLAWRRSRGGFGGSFHSLKHFAATWLLAQGLSREDVAIQLGHTDAAGRPYTRLVERVYGHPDHESALARIERAAA